MKPSPSTRLPGMEDPELEEIETAARHYFKKRNDRQKKTTLEVEAKTNLLDIMRKLKRKTYRHGDLEIEIIPTSEKLRVRIASEEDEADAD